MANNQLLQTLSELNSKIEELLKTQESLKKKVSELEERNLFLVKQHEKDLFLLENAGKDIEFLTLSHKLAESPDNLISTRRHLIGLMRTINNCIRMIKEE